MKGQGEDGKEGRKGEASRAREWCSTSGTTENLLDTGGGGVLLISSRKDCFS